jgi:hypothetical protein
VSCSTQSVTKGPPAGKLRTVAEAIVGGLVGAAAVVLGILLSEWLNRVRRRREQLEIACRIIGNEGTVLMSMLRHPAPGDRLPQEFSHIIQQLGIVRSVARWPLRHHADIKGEANALTTRLTVAMIRWLDRGPLSNDEVRPILDGRLYRLVFGGDPLEDDIGAALKDAGLPSLDEIAGRADELSSAEVSDRPAT